MVCATLFPGKVRLWSLIWQAVNAFGAAHEYAEIAALLGDFWNIEECLLTKAGYESEGKAV